MTLCCDAGLGLKPALASRLKLTSLATSQYVMRTGDALMAPSLTDSFSTATLSFFAAAASNMPRASAQAKRSAVPLPSTDRLPAVMPSLGVRAVSAEMISMRS